MKFGRYLNKQKEPTWSPYYINYEALKDLINQGAQENERALTDNTGEISQTSLSVVRTAGRA